MQGTAVAVIINDPERLDSAERALIEAGHNVFGFRNETDALPQMEQLGIEIVLAEFSSGGTTNSRLIQHLRRHPATPLVALLDPAARIDTVDNLDGLVYDAVSQPFSMPAVTRAVGRAAERLALVAEVARLRSALADKGNGNQNTFEIPSLPEAGISLQNIERELLAKALEKFRGNQTRTARYLNISRRTLIYRIGKYKLREPAIAHARA